MSGAHTGQHGSDAYEPTGHPGLTHRDADWAGLRVLVAGLGVSGFAAADALAERGAVVTAVSADATEAIRERAHILDILDVDVRIGAEHAGHRARGHRAGRHLPGPAPRPPPARRTPRSRASRSGARSSWPGGCVPASGAAPWLTVTGTNGKTTTVNMLASILRAAGPARDQRRQRRHPAARGRAAPRAVRRAGRRAVQLPAALAALGGAGRLGLPQRRARPPRLARLARGLPAGQGPGLPEHRDRLRLQRAGPGHRAAGDGRRRRRGLPGDRLHPRRPRACPWSVSSTTCWPTARSSSSGAPPRPSWPRSPTCRATPRRWPRTTSPTPWPPRPWPARTACAPVAVRDGLRAFVPDPHRIADVAVVDGVRFVDDSKATNPHAAAASLLAFEHVVWVAGGLLKGAEVDDLVERRRRPAARRRPHRRRPGADRRGPRATRARRPRRRRARHGHWSHGSSSSRAAAALAAARRRRPARAGGRLDGHVRQLRRPRRRLRRGRAAPRGPTRRAPGIVSTTTSTARPRPRPAAREPGWRGALSPRRAASSRR